MHKVNIMRDLKSYISTFHAYLNKYICQKLCLEIRKLKYK